MGFLHGFIEGVRSVAPLAICLPPGANIRSITDAFIDWFALRQDLWPQPAVEGVRAMLGDLYPCR